MILSLSRHFTMSEDMFDCHTRLGESCAWAKAGDAAQHCAMPRTAPTTRNYPAPNVHGSEV